MNPVDWYPWGDEAFAKAKNDGKPIFLSIGYYTCHWCHQLAKESFEDAKTAAFINKHFIPIKVDREERPEVDAYYMGAVQAMTGGGGWPLSVFLTPDLKPFYGGTYFPPEPRYGMPSFMQVLEFVANLWKDKRGEVAANSQQVVAAISGTGKVERKEPARSVLDEGYAALAASFDAEHGGFGGAPKFPLPGSLEFLLRYHHRTGKELALRMVLATLDQMARGGIRDHVGGGFHRYSTDRVWLVPHFEKMLYDNALLAKVFAEAYQITRNEEYAGVVRETLGWILGEMKAEGGGFYAAQDADTVEGEGIYYTWTPGEVKEAVGDSYGEAFNSLYGVTKTGNFDGRSILHLAKGQGPTGEESKAVENTKRALYKARLRRPRPATDIKIMTSWNGLAVSALVTAGQVLGDDAYTNEAAGCARFVLKRLSKNGVLQRRFVGGEAALDGTLEDYGFFVQGLLDLFEATSEPEWLGESARLTRAMIERFGDGEKGGFFLSTDEVPAKVKESYDGPTPSGNSVASLNLVRLAEITGDAEFRKHAEKSIGFFGNELERSPSGHTTMLAALDLLLNGASEIVITAPDDKSMAGMRAEAFREYNPAKVVLAASKETYGDLSKLSGLLEGRRPTAKARAFVCQNFTCKLPAESVDALRVQLARPKG
jgi:uncharacterized protein YyaL (SSP411 family)